jgi:hypothetical protein
VRLAGCATRKALCVHPRTNSHVSSLAPCVCVCLCVFHAGLEWAPERFAGTLMGDYTNKDTRAYKLILEPEKLPAMFTEVLDEYNVSFPTQMHLVFFKDAIAHLSRIARILRQVRQRPAGRPMPLALRWRGRGAQAFHTLLLLVWSNEPCLFIVFPCVAPWQRAACGRWGLWAPVPHPPRRLCRRVQADNH